MEKEKSDNNVLSEMAKMYFIRNIRKRWRTNKSIARNKMDFNCSEKMLKSINESFEKLNKDHDIKNFNISLGRAISSEEKVYSLAKRTNFSYHGLHNCFSENGNATMKLLFKILDSYNLAISISDSKKSLKKEPFVSMNHAEHLINISRIAKEKGGISSLSKKTNFHEAALSRTLSKRGNPQLKYLIQILKALDLEISVNRVSAGPVEEIKPYIDEIILSLSKLNKREEKILRMRLGIEMERMATLREVGDRFDLTRQGVHQIESCALRKLGIL